MDKFPEFYFRGCRERNHIKPSKLPKPASPMAFFPPLPKTDEQVDLDSSISWDKNGNGLEYFIAIEREREDYGNIKYGIFKLSYPDTTFHLEKEGYKNQIILNEELDPNSNNDYHGNIRFRKEFFYTIRPDGSIGVDKPKLKQACFCFVDSQVEYIRRKEYDSEYDKEI